jgi:hypothetical protein
MIDAHCSSCDWDGYVDGLDIECPGCGQYEVLYENAAEEDWRTNPTPSEAGEGAAGEVGELAQSEEG